MLGTGGNRIGNTRGLRSAKFGKSDRIFRFLDFFDLIYTLAGSKRIPTAKSEGNVSFIDTPIKIRCEF